MSVALLDRGWYTLWFTGESHIVYNRRYGMKTLRAAMILEGLM